MQVLSADRSGGYSKILSIVTPGVIIKPPLQGSNLRGGLILIYCAILIDFLPRTAKYGSKFIPVNRIQQKISIFTSPFDRYQAGFWIALAIALAK